MTPYIVHGLTRSYFTRKVTGYLDYTDRPWRLEPCPPNLHPRAIEAGWTGGIPVVAKPDGEFMWDSTTIIEHLEHTTADGRSVLPADPTVRFLAYLLDDFSDEWFYRPAVGSRWSFPENTEAAGWQIAEELSVAIGAPGSFVRPNVVEAMTNSLPRLGVSPENISAWMDDVLVAWVRVLETHLADRAYLFGDRPSIADFAVFGANAAHFVGDPYCRDLLDEHGPAVVAHTHRLQLPHNHQFGGWLEGEIPDSLVALVAEAGRHYLPWVARATVDGAANVDFGKGVSAEIESTPFLDDARGIMLARYVALRSAELDAVLERAGVLQYFADYAGQATAVPHVKEKAQPVNNRPYAIN